MADSDHQVTALLQGNGGEQEGRKDTHPCPYTTPTAWREGGSQAATPLTAQSQNGWKEVTEVELLPSFSKGERESNLTPACFMWDKTERKMAKKKTGHLLTQHI